MIDLEHLAELEKAATPGPWCDPQRRVLYPGSPNAALANYLRNNCKQIITELRAARELAECAKNCFKMSATQTTGFALKKAIGNYYEAING